MNLCGACGQDFGSLTAFDRHRAGRHEYTYTEGLLMDPIREDGRRCLDAEELAARFVRNHFGRWSLPRHAAMGLALRAQSEA